MLIRILELFHDGYSQTAKTAKLSKSPWCNKTGPRDFFAGEEVHGE